ncbi:MAG: class I SAM-dependent methyltransferase [Bacteroidales bacterium]|nr:class I SAM-dependent methyltransferase [Bacteroidales bacterium]
MGVAEFLELFIRELEVNAELRGYYKLLDHKSRFLWRKSYLEQRLAYINRSVAAAPSRIWDAGCGYGTTALFLALQGHEVMGNTLEFYYDKIGKRLDYWSRYGNVNGFRVEYANLFDMQVTAQSFDAIITQDTLHHLEPIGDALRIFNQSLRQNGKLIVVEENGNNVFINLKNFQKRGFNKVTVYYDEKLQKEILFGNENARSMKRWSLLLTESGFEVPADSVEYIRFCLPVGFNSSNTKMIQEQERKLAGNCSLLRELLFFGINFTAVKSSKSQERDKGQGTRDKS